MTRVDAGALARFACELLAAHGLAEQHARVLAEALVWSELRGVASHGVARLPTYASWLRTGEMNHSARMVLARRAPALALLDADRAPGAVAMDEAVRAVAPMARECGVATVFVRHTTHTGALGFFTQALARQGFVGLALAASGPNMIYHGARVPGVSTAPLSIAVPAPGEPIVFDMASGATALGRILQARREGTPLPEGVAADAQGRATRDPNEAVAPLPLAGAKGSGLALMSELLCSAMAGAAILAPALAEPDRVHPHRQNAFLLAIDIEQLAPIGQAMSAVQALADAIHSLPPADGGAVRLPGERGGAERRLRERDGIPLAPAVVRELTHLAGPLDVALPWQRLSTES